MSDHLKRVDDQLDSFSDLLTSVLSANLTQVTVQQNEDVRKISAAVAIIAVPTMIAGVYGMNFEHMPEFGWQYGSPMALGIMVVVCGAQSLEKSKPRLPPVSTPRFTPPFARGSADGGGRS